MKHLILAAVVTLQTMAYAAGQERFRLEVPGANVTADATIAGNELVVVDQAGKTSVYVREAQFDSPDRAWQAYYSRSINQVIRWPESQTGNVQIGEFVGGSVRYRPSQMTIRAIERNSERPVLPPAMPRPGANQQEDIPANPLKTRPEAGARSEFIDSLQTFCESDL